MSQYFTVYRNGEKAEMLTIDELLEADLIEQEVSSRQVVNTEIDDETAEYLAHYGITF